MGKRRELSHRSHDVQVQLLRQRQQSQLEDRDMLRAEKTPEAQAALAARYGFAMRENGEFEQVVFANRAERRRWEKFDRQHNRSKKGGRK
ncbi:hypothetical protein K3K97_000887 [Salmonella enterica]|uniref:hypothetical protein n=1 Tax=Salmonella enterica TaxID=28901 RepID=UPI00107AC7DC|nr:hypothetical protein [Salmonella enterica]EDJ9242320.1 hypothetical protein [Salmonella enterica subsp. diarizonae]EAU4677122.1 hypothetical protein [Salmonella enterica]EBQ4288936.1 hypothetical protein [Salmonella enterica]EBQ4482890.1 hypothetical protein [Salmonella enterica]